MASTSSRTRTMTLAQEGQLVLLLDRTGPSARVRSCVEALARSQFFDPESLAELSASTEANAPDNLVRFLIQVLEPAMERGGTARQQEELLRLEQLVRKTFQELLPGVDIETMIDREIAAAPPSPRTEIRSLMDRMQVSDAFSEKSKRVFQAYADRIKERDLRQAEEQEEAALSLCYLCGEEVLPALDGRPSDDGSQVFKDELIMSLKQVLPEGANLHEWLQGAGVLLKEFGVTDGAVKALKRIHGQRMDALQREAEALDQAMSDRFRETQRAGAQLQARRAAFYEEASRRVEAHNAELARIGPRMAANAAQYQRRLTELKAMEQQQAKIEDDLSKLAQGT